MKEIGYRADFENLDDFTLNCFLIISRVFAKCRDEKMKQEQAKRQGGKGGRR